jgi:hypothetical protein
MTQRSRKAGFAMVLALAVAGLSACGEKPQTTSKRKADVEPWMGVQTSWDNQLRKRAQGQNEYTRTSP